MNNHDLLSRRGALITAAGLACAVAGAGLGSTSAVADSSSPAPAATASPTPTPTGPEGGGTRADPSDGGATGIVDATSASGFTMTTATGVKVTVTESSATKTTGAPAKAVKKGASVLVLGTVDSATVAATRVVVQRGGDGGAAAAEAAGVIAFQQGTPSPGKSVGRIPDYTEGEGTIVNGTTAYKAIKAAQAVVPGGINDRVVQLSDGEYEVHNISVNWPHHVFVDRNFKVVGWE
ncbi:hypothetical protein [Streptomyces hokutonensis]|uniref:hypothetical protein n=1 Tax=Streptomyces hokutonensis TaxID=1306990 RepID=UPI00039FD4DF|nr:hypothetical protein [Streptomyces hokutonensis]